MSKQLGNDGVEAAHLRDACERSVAALSDLRDVVRGILHGGTQTAALERLPRRR